MARRMNKFFSILLVIGMILSMMPAAVFAATPSTLYLSTGSAWKSDGARFAAYFFGSSGNKWYSMTDADGDGVYECDAPTSGYASVIFCRMNPASSTNSWDNKWNQTVDLTIPTDGKNCYTISDPWGTDANGKLATGSWSTYKPASTCEHTYTSKVTTAATCKAPGVKTFTCSKCGDSYTESIATLSHTYVNGVCSACGFSKDDSIKIHFTNSLGWSGVVAHTWIKSGTTTSAVNGVEWPGQAVQKDESGLYTLVLDYVPVSGKTLGVLFHDFAGNQTADVTFTYADLTASREFWLQPGTTKNDEGKYPCTRIANTLLSPVVNGTSVTFRYSGSATSVYLAGTMNNWSTTANKMTKSGNVWSVTMTLTPGVYEYKFIVNGEWITDPVNGNVGGYDGNSIVIVPDSAATPSDKITVKLHYKRSSYTNWNVYYWTAEGAGSAAFATVTGDQGRVATFTVDRSTNSKVGFKIRQSTSSNEWATVDQDYDRFIDLGDVQSGTVHYYVSSGVAAGTRVLDNDVVQVGAPAYANYDYENSAVWVKTGLPLTNTAASYFSIVDADGNATSIKVTGVELTSKDGKGYGYSLALSTPMTLNQMGTYQVKYENSYTTIYINAHDMFYSSKFAADYTYNGNDLGATWSKASTTFKVWAPTANKVAVKIYSEGDYGKGTELKYQEMTLGEKGVWSVTIAGDWNGKYYNYVVTHPGYSVEAVDPYAKSTGANGDRGMILDMDSTDPAGWDNDISPNAGMNYTDAIIYEMHIREMTLDSTSGVKSAWRGKYLGMTQDGTSYQGRATGLAHLKELGVTHVQIMPSFDFKAVDEYYSSNYAWGYDPQNYNVPEGSYSTDPHKGEVRVNEFKQMVQTFHSNGINVVMDVVFNHTFSGGDFCYNQIVPNYFSRFYGEGNWSNGSGVGNDLATERTMVRNYIVDSIMHWVEEYHVDGFRFDLAGLIDVTTINEIVNTVHGRYPHVIFYGEGWGVGGTAVEYGHTLATKDQAWQTPGFGFFSDTFREAVLPNSTDVWGFGTGSGDVADAVARYMRASTEWCTSPSQLINYTSCHDNYCLTDKIILTRGGLSWSDMAKMNRLTAATTLLSQGVPFIYSGDEMLREKKDGYGNRYHNCYDGPDDVTKIKWSELVSKDQAQITDDYYAGLIEFRKNHAALRTPVGGDAYNKTHYTKISNNCIMLYVEGGFNYECSSGIVILLNNGGSTAYVNLNGKVPNGTWNVCIHGDKAGVESLRTVNVTSSSGNVDVEPYSATVLVLGDLVHEGSVYNTQAYKCSHSSHNIGGLCTSCGAAVEHTYVSGKCSKCGLSESAPETYTIYYDNSTTKWSSVYAYAWTTAGSRTKMYTDPWPGTAMTLVDAAKNIYAIEVPVGVENVIFNNKEGGDGNQTADLKAPGYADTKNMYSGTTWVAYTAECSHSYTSKVTTAATCTKAGVKTFTCSKCGDSYTEAIPALGHSYSESVVDATCDADGLKTFTCSGCGDSYTEVIPSSGHNYVGGVCTNCGAADPNACEEHTWVYKFENQVHTFTCSECGKVVTGAAAAGEKKFAMTGAAPVLKDDIVIKIGVRVPTGFSDVYAVVNFHGEDYYYYGDVENGAVTFAFDKICPMYVGDNFKTTIYATFQGQTVSICKESYSMLEYAVGQLNKTTISANLRTALSDLLVYAEKAQLHFGWNTENLVTEGLDALMTPTTYVGPTAEQNKQALVGEKSAQVDFRGASLLLQSKIVLRYSIQTSDPYAQTYKITVGGDTYEFTGDDLVLQSETATDMYYLCFDVLKATQFDETIVCAFYDGETQVGRSAEYSVNTYVYRNVGNATGTLKDVLMALYNYGEAARNI